MWKEAFVMKLKIFSRDFLAGLRKLTKNIRIVDVPEKIRNVNIQTTLQVLAHLSNVSLEVRTSTLMKGGGVSGVV
jgi:hypothetical protein